MKTKNDSCFGFLCGCCLFRCCFYVINQAKTTNDESNLKSCINTSSEKQQKTAKPMKDTRGRHRVSHGETN
jgi:hypothetical protein